VTSPLTTEESVEGVITAFSLIIRADFSREDVENYPRRWSFFNHVIVCRGVHELAAGECRYRISYSKRRRLFSLTLKRRPAQPNLARFRSFYRGKGIDSCGVYFANRGSFFPRIVKEAGNFSAILRPQRESIPTLMKKDWGVQPVPERGVDPFKNGPGVDSFGVYHNPAGGANSIWSGRGVDSCGVHPVPGGGVHSTIWNLHQTRAGSRNMAYFR
jgi:hypothetical protein